jgi:hypothetical protein
MSEGTQLLGEAFELGAHDLISNIIEAGRKL